MAKHSGFWTGLALATALAAPAWAEGETADTVVATVNGSAITLGNMIALRETLPQDYQALPDDVLFNGILDQLIKQEALRQSVTDLSPRAAATLDNEARGYLSGVVISQIVDAAVTDEALQSAYDARYKDAAPASEYNAAHILVETVEEAEALKAELSAGADFAELARAHSTDTGSGANGGDLGWFGVGTMVKPFEDAVVAAVVGEVVGPVQSDFGQHLILVRETRNAAIPTLDDVRPDLVAEIETAAIEAHIAKLSEGATITRDGEGLDPALLKNSALID